MIKNFKYRNKTRLAPLGSVLAKTLKKMEIGGALRQYQVFRVWEEAVGEAVSRVTQPYDIRFKTLYVHVRDSVWKRQLIFLEERMIRNINDCLKAQVVKKINFKVGEIIPRKMEEKLPDLPPRQVVGPDDRDIASLEDSSLKEVLRRIQAKSQRGGKE